MITLPNLENVNQANARVRLAGLDIVRSLAIICVIGGHYFINTDFNSTPFNSIGMFLLGMLQTFTLIGVPLFIMITGYLNANKLEASKKYFIGIFRVLIAYLIFSVITIIFRKYYLGHDFTFLQWVHSVFSFEVIPYAWYIEMWIGLFLMVPFLNKLWQAVDNKKQRLSLLTILFLCSALPDFTNRYGLNILPDYWRDAAYPLLCFYLGNYIRSYSPRFNSMLLIGILTMLCMFNPIVSLMIAPDKPMMHIQGGPGGIVSIPIAFFTFILFYKKDIKTQYIKSLITKIAMLSLNMYLVAYLFDQLFYPLWKEFVGNSQKDLAPFYPLIILSLLIGTFTTSYIYEVIKDGLKRLKRAKDEKINEIIAENFKDLEGTRI